MQARLASDRRPPRIDAALDVQDTAPDRSPCLVPQRPLRWVLGLGLVGVGAELLLIEHHGARDEWVPLVALSLAGLALLVTARFPSPRSTGLMRLAMLGLIGSALVGLWLHYESNVEFQRELHPELEGLALVWATLRAKSPPALAPAVLAMLGAIGWITTLARPNA